MDRRIRSMIPRPADAMPTGRCRNSSDRQGDTLLPTAHRRHPRGLRPPEARLPMIFGCALCFAAFGVSCSQRSLPRPMADACVVREPAREQEARPRLDSAASTIDASDVPYVDTASRLATDEAHASTMEPVGPPTYGDGLVESGARRQFLDDVLARWYDAGIRSVRTLRTVRVPSEVEVVAPWCERFSTERGIPREFAGVEWHRHGVFRVCCKPTDDRVRVEWCFDLGEPTLTLEEMRQAREAFCDGATARRRPS